MSTGVEATQLEEEHLAKDDSLDPKGPKDRTVGPIHYMFLWVGDGVNLGNMTIGASLIVAGIATLNMVQTLAATIIAIGIISIIFALNDRLSYRTGIPYVVQLRMSFGEKGTILSSLLRGVPAIIWFGIQSWIGGTALNEIAKIVTGGAFDNIAICYVILIAVEVFLSMYGFKGIKWVETVASVVIVGSFILLFVLLLKNHSGAIADNWVSAKGSWGLPFWGMIMVFLGNYAALFLSAGDYSRELKTGISDKKRPFLYFSPIVVAYGFCLAIGAMLASATGITNPAMAMPVIFNNDAITLVVEAFIVLGAIAVNMVANIVSPTYVVQLFTKMKYKPAVVVCGLLATVSFPWLLVQESSAKGLDMFVLIYSAFLGPLVAILLVEYYILRKQNVDVTELYKKDGIFAGTNPNAMIALVIGAAAAFLLVDLAWVIGFVVAGIAYYVLMKHAYKKSPFKKGTIFE